MKKFFKTLSICLMCLCFCVTPVFLGGCGDKANANNNNNDSKPLQTSVKVDDVEYSIFHIGDVLYQHGTYLSAELSASFKWDMEILVKNLDDKIFTTNTSLFKIVSDNDNFIFETGKYHLTTTYVLQSGEEVSLESNSWQTIYFNDIKILSRSNWTGQSQEQRNKDIGQCATDFKTTLFSIYVGDVLIGQFRCDKFFSGT